MELSKELQERSVALVHAIARCGVTKPGGLFWEGEDLFLSANRLAAQYPDPDFEAAREIAGRSEVRSMAPLAALEQAALAGIKHGRGQ